MVDLTEIFKDMYRMKPITKESVERARDKDTKRICFATTHAAAPKRSTRAGYAGSFNHLHLTPTRFAWEQVVTRQRHEYAAQGAPLGIPTQGETVKEPILGA